MVKNNNIGEQRLFDVCFPEQIIWFVYSDKAIVDFECNSNFQTAESVKHSGQDKLRGLIFELGGQLTGQLDDELGDMCLIRNASKGLDECYVKATYIIVADYKDFERCGAYITALLKKQDEAGFPAAQLLTLKDFVELIVNLKEQ